MASPDQPETPPAPADAPALTGIQTPPETSANSSIPLPPMPKRPTFSVESFLRWRKTFDTVLVATVLVFSFAVSSFAVSNSDFFRQLATGRLLVQGQYQFGVDPFTFDSGGAYWVNHSWLFGLLVYLLYQIPAVGGAVLVVGKALLVTVLAVLLLRIGRRANRSWWIPAACTALAILTVSARVYLQPVCLSFLFLALTLWLLTTSRRQQTDSGPPAANNGWRLWLLLPLFALWVNCDEWFILGPLTVALYLGGEFVRQWLPSAGEEPDASRRRELGTLAAVLLAGLAACLVNPHHVHAFTLPPEFGLSPAADLIRHDLQFRNFFLSPLNQIYYTDPYVGLSVSGLSYFLLVLLGSVSFVLVSSQVPGWRLPLWLGFAALSLYNARAIPFFAIVAGPITSLNWLDYAAYRLGSEPRLTRPWRWWSLGGRAVTILLSLVLVVLTVPGWLQVRPYETHRLGWHVDADPSLEQAARQIKSWREAGLLPAETHWFNLRLDVANYLAWFAPGERAFHDNRVTQFHQTADDYLTIRDSLEHVIRDSDAGPEDDGGAAKTEWRTVLHKRGVQFWILDGNNPQRAAIAARLILFANPLEWELCYLHGRIAIFTWKGLRGDEGPHPSPSPLELKQLAFGREADQAPPQGPENVTGPRDWWTAWWQAPPPASPDRETAWLHDTRFYALGGRYIHESSRDWQAATAVSTIGDALPLGPIPNCLLALSLSWGRTYDELFPAGAQQPVRQVADRERPAVIATLAYRQSRDAGPPESLYLGIRAARRALLVNPDDADTYYLLAQAYTRLDSATPEGYFDQALPLMKEMRRTQLLGALQNCLRCGPNLRRAAEVHRQLAQEFAQRNYLDLVVHHARERLHCLRASGPLSEDSTSQFAQQLDQLARRVTDLEDRLKRQLDEYEVNAANRPALQKAQVALDKGLADKAANILEHADVDELSDARGVPGIARLFLDLGRLDKARDVLLPDEEMAAEPLASHYLDLHLRLAAARGDYAYADRRLAEALNHVWKEPAGQQPRPKPVEQAAFLLRQALLMEARHLAGGVQMPFPTPDLSSEFWRRRWRSEAIQSALFAGQQRVEWSLLRGWLALEAGRCTEAREHFRMARDWVVPEAAWVPEINRLQAVIGQEASDRLVQLVARQNATRHLCERYLKWLDAEQR